MEPPMARNAWFMAFLGHFGLPQGPPGAILVGPIGTNRLSWMYLAQIHPFGATGANYVQKCLFYGIFRQFMAINLTYNIDVLKLDLHPT